METPSITRRGTWVALARAGRRPAALARAGPTPAAGLCSGLTRARVRSATGTIGRSLATEAISFLGRATPTTINRP